MNIRPVVTTQNLNYKFNCNYLVKTIASGGKFMKKTTTFQMTESIFSIENPSRNEGTFSFIICSVNLLKRGF